MSKTISILAIYFLAGVLILTIGDYLIFKNFEPVRNIIAGLLAVVVYYFLSKKSLAK